MSAEIEGTKRVRDSLDFTLKPTLDAFVEASMKAKHGARWLHYASRTASERPNDPLDAYGLLKTILDNWVEVFSSRFDRNVVHKARRLVSTVFEARNATAHIKIPLSDGEVLTYLFAMAELAALLRAPAKALDTIKATYNDQRAMGLAAGSAGAAPAGGGTVAPPAAVPAASAAPPAAVSPAPPGAPSSLRLDLSRHEDDRRPLKPWIEAALPHPDVLAGKTKEAEFAADLFAVDAGNVAPTSEYATAKSFFEITFLTEGLRRVLQTVLERLGGTGGDPVVGLQTSFGGGKTHTMLAAYHLARATELGPLRGIADLAGAAGVAAWRPAKVAVFVGTSKGVDTPLILKDGPKVRTLWGYLGWRLAGQPGLDLMAEAEAAGTSPASELLVALFRLSGPALILLDELVAYARQLPDDRFEAFLSFIQSLTEAAKMSPGVLIIGSLPESDAEAGGEKGAQALRRLQAVFGRVHSPWLPAQGDETYEIIRRRLFQELDAEGERARGETVKAFHDLYKKNAAEFPPEARESRYYDLLRLSYPIHPELFDRLSKDWAALEKFQRTRGVLRFMANVVGVLWRDEARGPLIMPSNVPIAHERVRASVLYPLDPAFGAVVDKEVDGDGSLAAQIEASQPTRRISRDRAVTRAARAVFLCSAPSVGGPNAGLSKERLRLACAEPGNQLSVFIEAIDALAEKATYLYEEAGRYWFSTQPTLNRLADDRAKALAAHEVDVAIAQVLRDDAGTKGGFQRVFAAPDDPIAIDEAQALSLVVLGPSTPHSGKGVAKSAATELVTETLMRCRASQRRFRNTLLFAAADEGLLAGAREAMRKAIAWDEICNDKRLQAQITTQQVADTKDKAKTSRDGAAKAVRLAWSHILFPIKTDATAAGSAFDLDHLSLSAKDRAAIPQAVYEKAEGDGIAKRKLGPDALWLHLKPLWPSDKPHLSISEITQWFAAYVYLPKLRDGFVLQGGIRDAVAKLDPAFGYADSFDDSAGEYRGLVWAKAAPEFMPATAVLVRQQVALHQLGRTAAPSTPEPPPGDRPGSGARDQGGPTQPSAPSLPKRFWGSVEIDMVRPVKSFDAILNAVVMELQRTPGARVKLTLEIDVEAAGGFAENDIGVVRDNARQLKFKAESTGFGD